MNLTDLRPVCETHMSSIYFCNRDGEEVVLKTNRYETSENELLRILNQLKAPVVPLLQVSSLEINGEHRQASVMAKAQADLHDVLQEKKKLSVASSLRVLKDVATALQSLHELGFAHRDVGCENVLMFEEGFRLCDFGLATPHDAPPVFAGKIAYTAPELFDKRLLKGRYDLRWSDAYSLGIVFFCCLVGFLPWESGAVFKDRAKWQSLSHRLASFRPKLRYLLEGLLCPIPSFRLNMSEVLIKIKEFV